MMYTVKTTRLLCLLLELDGVPGYSGTCESTRDSRVQVYIKGLLLDLLYWTRGYPQLHAVGYPGPEKLDTFQLYLGIVQYFQRILKS